jgi:hypothetical protein
MYFFLGTSVTAFLLILSVKYSEVKEEVKSKTVNVSNLPGNNSQMTESCYHMDFSALTAARNDALDQARAAKATGQTARADSLLGNVFALSKTLKIMEARQKAETVQKK